MPVQRTTTPVCAADIMTSNPVRVTPDVTAVELARLLDANEISGVPVVDSLDRSFRPRRDPFGRRSRPQASRLDFNVARPALCWSKMARRWSRAKVKWEMSA
ncbi:MAG: CBS domain-containing protein [Planctomycetes bacterium]|nr:CBS domain-containing protein [Planctomycetota bacterium]MCH8212269.1 CBS domain-containing protein [Planctomycetota bacterium]MCH8260000.1 CBS domain-containing protein [Planctomycetota bacterium]